MCTGSDGPSWGTYSLLLAIIIFFSPASAAMERFFYLATPKANLLFKKTMKNYQCQKCRKLVTTNDPPSFIGCTNARFHKWSYLGVTGEAAFKCAKCQTHIRSRSFPATLHCPEQGLHSWEKI
jgi:hypothetical protein